MPPRRRKQAEPLGFEETLWKTADTLRGSMDTASYEHVVLGLIFLEYISDAFTERRLALADELVADGIPRERTGALLESRAEYTGA